MLADQALLGTATDDLYEAFADYARPTWFEGCACCWAGTPIRASELSRERGSVAVTAPGGSRPLRDLPAEELEELAAQLPHLGGTTEVYKHYLPRILELAAVEGFEWPDLEIVCSNLNYDRPWVDWPAAEAAAIRGFFHAYWRDRLAARPCRIGEALAAIAAADPDIDWYLATWLEFETPAAALNLVRYLEDNSYELARGRLADDFYEIDHGPGRANQVRVIAWLKDPTTRDSVAAAADRARSATEREALEECYLRWLS